MAIDWRKRYPRPHPDAVWCDECLRYETGDARFQRVKRTPLIRLLFLVARIVAWPGNFVAAWLHDRADVLQVRANIRRGEFDVRAENK